MSKYECPECGGGFPGPAKWRGEPVCPWCYEPFLRHHSAAEYMVAEIDTTRSEAPDE